MQHLVIVARDRPELFESLTHRFAGDTDVDVLLDRRVRALLADLSRVYSEDRRQNPEDLEARLWVEGYVIVRLV